MIYLIQNSNCLRNSQLGEKRWLLHRLTVPDHLHVSWNLCCHTISCSGKPHPTSLIKQCFFHCFSIKKLMASPLQRFNVSSACGAERLMVVHGLRQGWAKNSHDFEKKTSSFFSFPHSSFHLISFMWFMSLNLLISFVWNLFDTFAFKRWSTVQKKRDGFFCSLDAGWRCRRQCQWAAASQHSKVCLFPSAYSERCSRSAQRFKRSSGTSWVISG